MDMQRNFTMTRPLAQTARFFSLTLTVALGLATTASAGLVGTTYSIRYDGHVKSGLNVGVEGHSAAAIVFDAFNGTIPVSINPPAPLAPARPLNVNETEFGAPGGKTHAILDIQGDFASGGPDVFVNPLDPAFLLELELQFVDPSIGPTEKLAIDVADPNALYLDNFGVFPIQPATKQVTGLGTAASPLRILLGITPSTLPTNKGRVKVHFFYMEMDRIIPEPTSIGLAMIGLVGLAGLARRRQS
jgi:hypothetical protein